MVESVPSRKLKQVRSSPRARRIGIVLLGTIVAGYLWIVSIASADRLDSPKHVGIFIILWLLGLTALGLLVRGWREVRRTTTTSGKVHY
jgi:hypothetical protein